MLRSGTTWKRWQCIRLVHGLEGKLSTPVVCSIAVLSVLIFPQVVLGSTEIREFVEEEYVKPVSPKTLSRNPIETATLHERTSRTLFDVYLDEDRSFVKEDLLVALEESVESMQMDPFSILNIETYCDRRGSSAYSLALGHRRGWQIREFVQNLGIPQSSLHSMSYGNESPQCHDMSRTCWEEHARTQLTFRYVAITKPKLGCLGRLRIHGPHLQTTKEQSERFLQKIRFASPRTKHSVTLFSASHQ